MKLADQITTAHQPDIAAVRRMHHLFVNWRHVPRHESDIRAFDPWQLAAAEHPGWDGVLPLAGIIEEAGVIRDPLVRRRAHRHSSDLRDEPRIVIFDPGLLAELKEPGQRVV